MKTLIMACAALAIELAPVARATIGDTEARLIAKAGGKLEVSKQVSPDLKCLVFKNGRHTFMATLLNGKSECESIWYTDNAVIPMSFINGLLESYAPLATWSIVPADADQIGFVSSKAQVYVTYGGHKHVVTNTVMVASIKWARYALDHDVPQIAKQLLKP